MLAIVVPRSAAHWFGSAAECVSKCRQCRCTKHAWASHSEHSDCSLVYHSNFSTNFVNYGTVGQNTMTTTRLRVSLAEQQLIEDVHDAALKSTINPVSRRNGYSKTIQNNADYEHLRVRVNFQKTTFILFFFLCLTSFLVYVFQSKMSTFIEPLRKPSNNIGILTNRFRRFIGCLVFWYESGFEWTRFCTGFYCSVILIFWK